MNYTNNQFDDCVCSKDDVLFLINECNDILDDQNKSNHFKRMRRIIHKITNRNKLLRELEKAETPDSYINKMLYNTAIQSKNRLAEDFEIECLWLDMKKEDVTTLLGTYIETCVVFWGNIETKDLYYGEGIYRKGVSHIENGNLYLKNQVNPYNMLLECIEKRSREIDEITQITEEHLFSTKIGVLE